MLMLATGCGGERALTLEDVAQAATTSSEALTGRFTFAMDMTAPDGYETISFSGYGSFDTEARRSQLSLDMSALASFLAGLAPDSGDPASLSDPELWKIEAVLDDLVMYMRFPLLARLPGAPLGGKTWVKIDLERSASMAGLDLDQITRFTSNDPRESLRLLEAVSGGLQELGEEEVHGVDTTHYRTSVDLRKYEQLVPASERERAMVDELVQQSGLETLPVEVWIDDESLIHRMTVALSQPDAGVGQGLNATVRFELFDYGEPVAIAVPPPAETFDATTPAGG